MSNVFNELRRRNVFRVAGVYAVVGWLLAQVAVTLETALNLPGWFDTIIVSTLLMGLPIAMLFAWAFEITPTGVVRTTSVHPDNSITPQTGRKLDVAIAAGLVAVIGLIGWQITTTNTTPAEIASLTDTQTSTDGILNVPASYIAETELLPTAAVAPETIAVLPFEDFSPNKDQGYFASGISEELLNVLARIDGLRVSSRTSAFAFKGLTTPISEIGDALNVAHVVEGSVRKSGQTLRITAQLVDAKTDAHLWSETYDRPLTTNNIFAIQDDIAAAIVGELKGRLNFDAERNNLSRTSSVEAYEYYLHARENLNKREPETLAAAIEGFKKVIDLDANFAPAFAGLADAYLHSAAYAGADEINAMAMARDNVERALELAPTSAEALTAGAYLAIREFDYPKALALSTQAIESNPNHTTAYHRQGSAYAGFQPEKALAAYQKALELDPLSDVLLSNVAAEQMTIGDLAAARITSEKNIRWNPNSPHGYIMLATINWEEADYAGAHHLYKDALALNPDNASAQSYLLTLYSDLGMFDAALPLAKTPYLKGLLHSVAGQPDAARKYFNQLSDLNKSNLAYYLGDFELASKLIEPKLPDLFPVNQPITSEMCHEAAKVAAMFSISGLDNGVDLLKRLDVYFKDKKPSELQNYSDLYGGAILQIAKGTPEKAYPWLQRRVDLGYADFDLNHKIFDIIRDTPEFRAIKTRNDANSNKQRALIQNQLANPETNWVIDGKQSVAATD